MIVAGIWCDQLKPITQEDDLWILDKAAWHQNPFYWVTVYRSNHHWSQHSGKHFMQCLVVWTVCCCVKPYILSVLPHSKWLNISSVVSLPLLNIIMKLSAAHWSFYTLLNVKLLLFSSVLFLSQTQCCVPCTWIVCHDYDVNQCSHSVKMKRGQLGLSRMRWDEIGDYKRSRSALLGRHVTEL